MTASGHALGLVLSTLVLGGCVSTKVVPPPAPLDPVPVFILDHGRHTSLVLAAADQSLHRYAYGDWRYYAMRDTSFGAGVAALLWPTPAALGHRKLAGPATAAALRSQVPVSIEHLHKLLVERSKADRLRAELDALIAMADTRLEVAKMGLAFVPHPQDYSLGHNSNQVVADWLVLLGCEVSRRPILADWVVKEPGN